MLDRFRPPLAPWTRRPACNGPLAPVAKAAVAAVLPPGTRRTCQAFSRCRDCGQVYWHGAHSKHRAWAHGSSCAPMTPPPCTRPASRQD